MTTTPFEHSPLDLADPRAMHILELLPSRDLKGPIRCEMHHHSLDQDIEYEALSYTWGDHEPGHTVLINGSHTLDVTPNCLQAMACLRRRFHRRPLWIDAICIDQRENNTSKRERDRQVEIMGDIYHKARKVLVWLGPAEPSTSRTIARLKFIQKVEAVWRSPIVTSHAQHASKEYLSKRMIKYSNVEIRIRPRYLALVSMISSPWWQRVWTLQEQILSRQCEAYQGRKSIPMHFFKTETLEDIIDFLTYGHRYYNHDARHHIHRACQPDNDWGSIKFNPYQSQHASFMAKFLLDMAFSLEAKHPIDKIYGLYGILTRYCDLPLPAPDYNKTAEQVYEETVWAWINTRGDLSILKLAARPDLVHKLPSWVPAWHKQHPTSIRNIDPSSMPRRFRPLKKGHFNWGHHYYDVEKNSNPPRKIGDPVSYARVISHGKLQIIQARFVGRISHAIGTDSSKEYACYHESVEYLCIHLDWCRLLHNIFSDRTTEYEEVLHEMFRSVWIPGIQNYSDYDPETKEGFFEPFRVWFNFMLYLHETSGNPVSLFSRMDDTECKQRSGVSLYSDVCTAEHEEEATSVLERCYRGDVQGREGLTKLARHVRFTKNSLLHMRNHSLCILDNDNMIAITDYWCQEGDEVFVFPGTDSPFVLRREPNGDCYRLVGPALVDRLLRVGYQNWRSEGDNLQNIVLI